MTKGNRIVKMREALGLAQVDVAKAIGVSKQTLYKYENDIVTNIPSDKIEALAHVLETTPEYIMGWETEAPVSSTAKKAIEIYNSIMSLPPSDQEAILTLLQSLQKKS